MTMTSLGFNTLGLELNPTELSHILEVNFPDVIKVETELGFSYFSLEL